MSATRVSPNVGLMVSRQASQFRLVVEGFQKTGPGATVTPQPWRPETAAADGAAAAAPANDG